MLSNFINMKFKTLLGILIVAGLSIGLVALALPTITYQNTNIQFKRAVIDSASSTGNSGQVFTSTGTSTLWATSTASVPDPLTIGAINAANVTTTNLYVTASTTLNGGFRFGDSGNASGKNLLMTYLNVSNTLDVTGATIIGLNVTSTFNTSGIAYLVNDQTFTGRNTFALDRTNIADGFMQSIDNSLNFYGTSTASSAIAGGSEVFNFGSGLIDSAVGSVGNVQNAGLGTIGTGIGFLAMMQNTSSSLFSSSTGMLIMTAENSGGGTYNSVIGLEIQDQSGIGINESYNIMSRGVSSLNIFEGEIRGGGNLVPNFQSPTVTIASSSWTIGATTSIPLGVAVIPETWQKIICYTDVETSTVSFGDGTNNMPDLVVNTTPVSTTVSVNNTFTTLEKRYINVGNFTGTPNYLSCSIRKNY